MDFDFNPRKIIGNPSDIELRNLAMEQGGIVTQFGNLSVISKVRNRSAKFTEVILRDLNDGERELIKEAFEYIKNIEVIQLDRTMCTDHEFKVQCRIYVDASYARLPLMWGNTLFPPEGKEPEFTSIVLPAWPTRKVLVIPDYGLTISLGTDYKGEIKKSMLRKLMYRVKKKNCLGLHASSKILRINKNDGLEDVQFIFFGLSGTGKTSLSCHSHWFNYPERVVIRQDDVIILEPTRKCYGTEDSYYIKTDALEPHSQPLLYAAAISPRAILENVKVHSGGNRVDFFDESLTSNGRAMVKRSDVAFTDDRIDIDGVDNVIFITRRYDIVPPVAKLTPEWAAVAFMLGESVETSAGDPEQAGQAKRVVGTNPFIIGSEAEEGNIFYDLIKKNPEINCYILNTGRIGGERGGTKISIRDSVTIIEMIARDKIKWGKDNYWKYEIPYDIPGIDIDRFNPQNYYENSMFNEIQEDLRRERRKWLKQFETLNPKIRNIFG
ncbi:MAG: phosphoenolpyruvate carboxykinase (ATP) [Candidatus Helarchaeota archaeon]|nr:phosphoenolpyruvate carboxykinase (ATP) [Candidatus Helarchaeota archaeon]